MYLLADMHHLSSYYHPYSTTSPADLLKSLILAQQSRSNRELMLPPTGSSALPPPFTIESLLASSPLVAQPLRTTAPYFPYFPSAPAAGYNIPSQRELIAAGERHFHTASYVCVTLPTPICYIYPTIFILYCSSNPV